MDIKKMIVPLGLKNNPNSTMTSVEYITIHNTANRNIWATAEAHAKYLYDGSDSNEVSWHYTVDDNEIWQSFYDDAVCWHTGLKKGNMCSIGVEICVNKGEQEFASACNNAAWLVSCLLKKHGLGIDRVVEHNYYTGKDCPKELRSGIWGINFEDFVTKIKNNVGKHSGV